jgi:tetratricopeptide (TPR) repeat protein/predicted aspartyl protease
MRSLTLLSLALAAALCAAPAAAASKCHLGRMAELPVRMSTLVPLVTAKIDGTDVTLVADTGAFFSLLLPSTAKRLDLKLGSSVEARQIAGFNGTADIGVSRAKDFTLLGMTLHNVDFLVAGVRLGGDADGSLGQNMLGFADMEYDLGAGAIRFFKAFDCEHDDLAYWTDGKPYSAIEIEPIRMASNQIRAVVTVNGVRMHAMLDTGTPRSVISLAAAKRAGVRMDDPNVGPGGAAGGIADKFVQTWIAPFKSFAIGDEQVQNTKLMVADFDIPDTDMLLGADFFLSHRIFVAKSQQRLYFTYSGGAVFDLTGVNANLAAGSAAVADDAPKDEAAFIRRGQADVSRREFGQAVADFSQAVALAPTDPEPVVDRAMAHWSSGDLASTREDLDAALGLKPADPAYLVDRGKLRLEVKDDAGARADFDAAEQADHAKVEDVAYIYQQELRFPDSVAEYGKLVVAGADHDQQALALNNRCWTRALWGQELDRALDDCNEALELKPNFAAYLDSRGLVELRLGRFDAAIADYTAALHKMPQSPWTLYGRGLAEQRQGLKARGDADIAAATALAPGLPKRLQSLGILPK